MKKATDQDQANAHVSVEQEHFRWHIDHLESLAMLHRLEAEILAHEAEIVAHRARIAAEGNEQDRSFESQHEEARHRHKRLTKAILALGEWL